MTMREQSLSAIGDERRQVRCNCPAATTRGATMYGDGCYPQNISVSLCLRRPLVMASAPSATDPKYVRWYKDLSMKARTFHRAHAARDSACSEKGELKALDQADERVDSATSLQYSRIWLSSAERTHRSARCAARCQEFQYPTASRRRQRPIVSFCTTMRWTRVLKRCCLTWT